MQTILVAEDDDVQRMILVRLLENRLGYQCLEANNGAQALYRIKKDDQREISAVIMDLEMPEMDGRVALEKMLAVRPDLPIIILTASQELEDVVAMMRQGAVDFLLKPIDKDRLEISLLQALRLQDLHKELQLLRSAVGQEVNGFEEIIGHDGGLQTAVKLATRAASSDITVLLTGESGSGKERFARAIHEESARHERPFIAVNCGALPKDLVESTLFGHRKGAFTGAVADAMGKFREADGGTLFLDEVGELPLEAQVKLLRALQQREVEPVGEGKAVAVNVRVVAATNRHPMEEVRKGRFREDLYYRLNVYPIHLPPLRERRQDIRGLCTYFMQHYAALEKKPLMRISDDAMIWLTTHSWPGNVRELENTLYRAVLLCDEETLRLEHVLAGMPLCSFAEELHDPRSVESSNTQAARSSIMLFEPSGAAKTMEALRQEIIAAYLALYDGNVVKAAQALDVGKSTLYRALSS